MTKLVSTFWSLTFNVRDDEHLWLGQAFLEVVEVDGAVKGDEANLCPGVSREPGTHMVSQPILTGYSDVWSGSVNIDFLLIAQYFCKLFYFCV